MFGKYFLSLCDNKLKTSIILSFNSVSLKDHVAQLKTTALLLTMAISDVLIILAAGEPLPSYEFYKSRHSVS